MTKFSKKVTLILVAVLCLVLCVGVLVACNPTEEKEPTHTVTVLLPDETAAVGVDVTIKKGAAKLGTVATNSEGKAGFILADDDYTVEIAAPEHFGLAEDADLSLSSEEHELTVTLVEDFHYTVTFRNVDTNTNFHDEDLNVQICTVVEGVGSGNCFSPDVFVNGVAKFYEVEPGNYQVSFDGLPEEYELANPSDFDDEGHHVHTLTADDTTIDIFVKHVVNVTTNDIHVAEEIAPYADQDYVLKGVPMDGTAELVYSDDDTYYHLGTADGPVVVVLLVGDNDIDRFGDGSLAYFEITNTGMATYLVDVTPDDAPAYTKVYDDYRLFLRGFKDYDFNPVMTIPSNITEEKYYTANVNSDGVYPLNKELKAFLEVFYNANKSTVDFNTYDAEDAWLFPCYYYDETTPKPSTTDAIIGEYKLVSFKELVSWQDEDYVSYEEWKVIAVGDEFEDNIVTEEFYTLKVTDDGNFKVVSVTMRGEVVKFSGKWTSNGNGGYTLTNCADSWGEPIDATVTFNASTGEITFVFAQSSFDENWEPITVDCPYVFKKA